MLGTLSEKKNGPESLEWKEKLYLAECDIAKLEEENAALRRSAEEIRAAQTKEELPSFDNDGSEAYKLREECLNLKFELESRELRLVRAYVVSLKYNPPIYVPSCF